MKPVEVLLVEDKAGDILLIRRALGRESIPISIHVAVDGKQAIQMLAARQFEPDLRNSRSEHSKAATKKRTAERLERERQARKRGVNRVRVQGGSRTTRVSAPAMDPIGFHAGAHDTRLSHVPGCPEVIPRGH